MNETKKLQKELGGYLNDISYIAGSAIMGDGKIGLILSVDGIVSKFQE